MTPRPIQPTVINPSFTGAGSVGDNAAGALDDMDILFTFFVNAIFASRAF
jgi:hypothetical protein